MDVNLFGYVVIAVFVVGIIVVLVYEAKRSPPRKPDNYIKQVRKPSQADIEQELFDRIMREGTDDQKLIALQLQQNRKLDQLRGLVLFDIFFH